MPVLNRFSKLAALAFTLNLITAMMFNMTAFAPSASAQTASTAPKRLLGYYPEWGKTQTPPYTAAQISYSQLTHINHAFVLIAPGADGSLVIPSGMIEPALIKDAHAAAVMVSRVRVSTKCRRPKPRGRISSPTLSNCSRQTDMTASISTGKFPTS